MTEYAANKSGIHRTYCVDYCLDYDEALEAAQKSALNITAWLLWFIVCLDHAIDGVETILASAIRKARFWEGLSGRFRSSDARSAPIHAFLLEPNERWAADVVFLRKTADTWCGASFDQHRHQNGCR